MTFNLKLKTLVTKDNNFKVVVTVFITLRFADEKRYILKYRFLELLEVKKMEVNDLRSIVGYIRYHGQQL